MKKSILTILLIFSLCGCNQQDMSAEKGLVEKQKTSLCIESQASPSDSVQYYFEQARLGIGDAYVKIAQYYPHLFNSFREYIFQIYLMSLPFQGFVELVLWKRLFYNENLFLLFYVLNVLSGLLIPVLIAKYIERCNIKFIRLCFGLK